VLRSRGGAGTIDFGAVSYEPTAAQWAQLPNVQLVPMLGQAGLASYNVLASLFPVCRSNLLICTCWLTDNHVTIRYLSSWCKITRWS
jgi:hypothetical protein